MTFQPAQRLGQLPPYLFVQIDRRKREAIAAGRDVIDFGVGDPDLPTHEFIIDAMARSIRDPANHRYALGAGSMEFRTAVADFFHNRFDVALDPQTEVLALIGSKEGLGHLPLAVMNPGDVTLIPEPGYPVYTSATIFAGGIPHVMPLRAENDWLPVFEEIPTDIRRRAKLLFLNYPNNPTGACATKSFFEQAVKFARANDILLASDAAYSEMYFDEPPPSILQVEGGKEIAIELHSLSKTFNMTGWRVGFAVGNRDVLAALAKVKNNVDSGVFGAVQRAAIAALQRVGGQEVREQIGIYRRRRDILVGGLKEAGWSVAAPRATFYVWAKWPAGGDSMAAASRLLDEADVVAIPGLGFGACGEGNLRFALTVKEERTQAAVKRIAALKW